MKRILLFISALIALAVGAIAQQNCHDEMICTGVNGCRWVTFCKPPAPLPSPGPAPAPRMCHDEMICTGVNGCRWVTICK